MSAVEREPTDAVVLTGRLAHWLSGRAAAEGRTEAEIVEEALAVRWGRELGDAFRNLWDASETMSEAEAEELVRAEVYEPRRERRRQAG
jgi:myosin-crossreactive antigen